MNRYGPRRKGLPASQVLTYSDLIFCLEYAKNGQNGSAAYRKAHPKASMATSEVEAVRVLSKPSVSDFLDRLYKSAIPDTIETIKRDLELAYNLAVAAKDHNAIANISMDKAKLAGLLVDKQEVKTLTDAEAAPLRGLVVNSLS
jgi:hypothetical protein